MKMICTLIIISICSICFCQDTLKVNQIDALISNINRSKIQAQRDTLVQDYPDVGLKMTTYLTMVAKDGELLKYENLVKTIRKENAVTQEMTTSSAFYYDHNKLIKVEEFVVDGADKKTMDWYYADDKSFILHLTIC